MAPVRVYHGMVKKKPTVVIFMLLSRAQTEFTTVEHEPEKGERT